MTFTTLLLRNLLYHWRGNLAVFLGIALGSAVLTGALLVGDSLRGSLQSLSLDQLGWVEDAMVPGRFFRAKLAREVSAERRSPRLMLKGGAALKVGGEEKQRVGKVTVIGIPKNIGWPKPGEDDLQAIWSGRETYLNRTLADALGAKKDDLVELQVPRADSASGETLLGQRKAGQTIERIELRVAGIIPDEGIGRFSLKPSPEPVRNAFVPLSFLQERLKLDGLANVILVAKAHATLQEDLHHQLALEDWGLRYRSPKDRAEAFFQMLAGNSTEPQLKKVRWQGRLPEELEKIVQADGGLTKEHLIAYYEKSRDYYSLESKRMMLEPFVVRAVDKIAPAKEHLRWQLTPRLIYLADTLGDAKDEVPYSIIASDDTGDLKDNEVRLMQWPDSPLKVQPGGKINLTYYVPDATNQLVKKTEPFTVHSIEAIRGVFDDPDLVPEVPGVTDKLDIASWENPPFPYDFKRNKPSDIAFSKRFRTTPRAYVTLKKAKELWANRFGDLTSIQVRAGLELPASLERELLRELKPEQGNFIFQPVRKQALEASGGTTPFGVLFLMFSFFLIASALVLVGLLVRLNIDRRAGEMGLLLATGWDHGRVRRLLLCEGALLTLTGGAVGLVGALIYARLMLKLLSANWPGTAGLSFLTLHVEAASFVIGYAASVVVSVATLWWATRGLTKLSPRSLLSGETTQASFADSKPGWSRWLIPGGLFGALVLAVTAKFLPSHEWQAGCFFGSGALLLTACLAGVWHGLKWSNRTSSPQPTITLLGLRNAGRHAVRSVLTVGLLAAASFLIVAVESFHKDTDKHFHEPSGGSGGFALYAEGNLPVFEELNDEKVRIDLKLDTPEMRKVRFYPCRVQPGDDASCLNLYKPLKPRVVGVSNAFIARAGFHFGKTAATNDKERENLWRLLQRDNDAGVPCVIDNNTAQWVLGFKTVGDTVEVNTDRGETVKLVIVGLLKESIFQSEILVSETNFLKLYPTQSGFNFFLIDTAAADAATIKKIEEQLNKGLAIYGLDVATTASRLQGYLAVENMYLATFQALGGLGLILGAAGLAIVLLRGVWERRAELALLQALGFRSGQLAWLVLAENALLLALGLAAGTLSALLAVAPHLVGSGAQVLWLRIIGLLIGVLAVGVLSAALAVWSTLRTPVLTALRRE